MSITLKVAEYILQQGKVNPGQIIKNVPGVDNYNRCAEITEDLEKVGVLSKFNGHTPREVLIKDIDKIKLLLTEVNDPQIIKGNE